MATSKTRKRWFMVIIIVVTLLLCYLALKIYVGPAPKADGLTDWQKFNDSLNLANKNFAEKHPYKFTDRPRNVEKDSGIFRIAVLGDSFIWGDGLPYDSAWSHKLEQRILAERLDQAHRQLSVAFAAKRDGDVLRPDAERGAAGFRRL